MRRRGRSVLDGKPFISRYELLNTMVRPPNQLSIELTRNFFQSRALPTAKKQNDLLRRVGDAYKHGDAVTKKALSSNSLQKSPTVSDKNGKNNHQNGNNQNGNHRNNQRNGNGKGKGNNQNGTGGNDNSSGNTSRGNGNGGGGNHTPSTTDSTSGDPNNKKLKRRLAMAISCSICGFECGHSDIDCFKDPNSEDSKKAIEKNRSNAKMRDFFKAIDNAKKKRAN